MNQIVPAALAALIVSVVSARAATANPATTVAPGAAAKATNAPAGTATNAKPADVMASLFGDPVIAKGKGFEIKQSQLDELTDAFRARAASLGQTPPPDAIAVTALRSLIVNQILLQRATDADKAQGKKDADQYVADKIKQFGSEESVAQQLKAAGKTLADWRSEMAQQTTVTAVMIRELSAAPTEAEIKKFYDDHPAGAEQPEMAHVAHLLLLTIDPTTQQPMTDDQQKAKRKQIDDLLARARAGENFSNLVAKYSEDPGSKNKGGEYTFARASADPYHAMVPEFEAAAFSLTNNQVSDVVTTKYGFHIIKLLDKIPAKKLALADKLPQTDMTVAEAIKNQLTEQKLREQAPAYIEKLSRSPDVEILDAKLKAMVAAAAALTNAPAAPAAPVVPTAK